MRNSFAVDQPQVHRIKFSRYDGAIRYSSRQADPEASLEATGYKWQIKKLTLSEMFLTFQLDFYIDPKLRIESIEP